MKKKKAANRKKSQNLLLIAVILLIAAVFVIVYISLNKNHDKKINAQSPVTTVPGPTVRLIQGDFYLLGANYPWYSWGNDFTSSNGVVAGAPFNADFSDMKTKGVHVLRWNIFEGNAGIVYDASGTPTGFDPIVLKNLDAAVALARNNNIYLNLVFSDFGFFNKSGGHTGMFTDATKMNAFLNNVASPIVSHFPSEPYILSWEIMNEPEWAITDLPQNGANYTDLVPINKQQFWAYAAGFSNLVHTKTTSYVTVGSACLKWNKVWTNAYADSVGLPRLNLDYYQTHYYDWMAPYSTNDPVLGVTTWSPLTQKASALNLDKPIVVGEFQELTGSVAEDTIFANGYAGYWPWSYKYNSTNDRIQVNWGAYTPWEAAHSTLVRIPVPGNSIQPTTTPTVIPTSSPTVNPTVAPTPTPIPTPSPTLISANNFFTGKYYDNKDFTNLALTRADPAISFNWGYGSPAANIGPDTFSVRWDGNFEFTGGNYNFSATADDGIRVYIDGTRVLNKWFDQSPKTYTFSKTISAGTHSIRVDYYEKGGGAIAKFNWTKQ